jgi:hypothetical protein
MGFTKLDSGIINSSIWEEHSDVLKVFIAFWTKSSSEGIVTATEGSIFRSANLLDENKNPRDKQYFDKILLILLSPDQSSKTKDNDGKRILRIDESSWLIVNYKKYREYTYSDNPESVRKREYRKRDMSQSVLGHSASASASELELFNGNEDPKHDTVSKCEGVQGGEEKTWKIDYDVYQKECSDAFDELMENWSWIEERKGYHPGLRIRKSVEKMFYDYWGTERGWKRKKTSKSKDLDWMATANNGLTIKCNQVWLQKGERDEEKEFIEIMKKRAENAET